MTMAQMAGDPYKQRKLATLLETAENRYQFASPAYLNSLFPDIVPVSFRSWFTRTFILVSFLKTVRADLLQTTGPQCLSMPSGRVVHSWPRSREADQATMVCGIRDSLLGFDIAASHLDAARRARQNL